jgi:hypothetical protein
VQFAYIERRVTFLDEYKNKHEANVSFVQKGLHCFWDRHSFSGTGVQCPLRKEYQPILNIYKSHINDTTYAIQDTINTNDAVYITKDNFCSGECCLAWIEDHSHDPSYVDSKSLLFEILGKEVKPAGSWLLLKEYGGPQTIEEFRKNFSNKRYDFEGIIYKPAFFIYKETYCL